MAPEVLAAALNHADPEVLREAVIAGAALDGGVGLAEPNLDRPRWDVRVAAARALAAGGAGRRSPGCERCWKANRTRSRARPSRPAWSSCPGAEDPKPLE